MAVEACKNRKIQQIFARRLQIKRKLFREKKKSLKNTAVCFPHKRNHTQRTRRNETKHWNFCSIIWYFSIAPALTFDFQFRELSRNATVLVQTCEVREKCLFLTRNCSFLPFWLDFFPIVLTFGM